LSNYLNVDIPTFFAYLDTGFFYDQSPFVNRDRVVVEVFNFTSIPQRCAMFSVMTEYGSQHARVPIHYLRSNLYGGSDYPLDWIQLWDSISYYASVKIDQYCKNRSANIMLKDKTLHKAKYLFTIDWCLGPQYQNGYGEMAAGHKCGHFFEGIDGQYFLQPNNRVLWMDGGSFISKNFDKKPDWKVFSQEFSCENTGSRWVSESDEEMYFYEFKEKVDQPSKRK
jgi:hypothetical protein